MPVSRVRKKSKNKKGPTPNNPVKELRAMLDFLETAEQEYINQLNKNEEKKNA